MQYQNGPIENENAVYLIDDLKYYEKIDRTKRQLLISGWLFFKEAAGDPICAEIWVDGKSADTFPEIRIASELLLRQDVADMYNVKSPEIGFRIRLETEQLFSEIGRKIVVRITGQGKTEPVTVLSLPTDEETLSQIHVENIHYRIDQFALNGDTIRMAGWGYLSDLYEEYRPLTVWAEADGKRFGQAEYMLRPDIISLFGEPGKKDTENRKWGFFLLLDLKDHPECVIRFGEEGCFAELPVSLSKLRREKRERKRRYRSRWEMLAKADSMQKEDDRWYRANLSREEYEKIVAKRLKYKDVDYDIWMRRHLPTEKELRAQGKQRFQREPKISIAVPAYRTPEKFLREMIGSVQAQTYANWELCIADGSLDGSLTPVLTEYAKRDSRIRFVTLPENYGISGNTNRALEIATGEFLSLLDHDDVLTRDALYEVVKRINETDADCLYSDEDKVDFALEDYFEPHFKPDFNPDMLHSCNYICHFFVVRRDVFKRAGYFRPQYDGSQDFDFILRCTAEAKRIEHIRKMLYHWRSHAASTAMNPENKMYCYTAGRNAILSDLEKHGFWGARVENYTRLGYYEPFYPLPELPGVSIFTREESMERLRAAKEAGELYANTELLLLPEGGLLSGELSEKIKRAEGEYLLFLDGVFLEGSKDWVSRLLSNALRSEVGAIGGMVYNELGRITSSGKVVRENGVLLDLFRGLLKEEPGYAAHALMQQDVSAVSAKCLMIRREYYQAAGGFPKAASQMEAAAVLCKRLLNLGKLIVYTPFARVKEKEAPESEDIFVGEMQTGQSDPHYNPGFDPEGEAFTLTL